MRRQSLRGIIGLFVGVLCSLYSWGQASEVVQRCATMEALTHQRRGAHYNHEQLELLQNKITNIVRERRTHGVSERLMNELIRIPVVVHVIHNNRSGTIGGTSNSNISMSQIQSQIQILNEDYRRKLGTPGYNTNPVGVDTQIEFFLAQVDPDGMPSDGVTRHFYERNSFNPNSDAHLLATISSWPADQYLNIWVCGLSGNYLGIAQFPSVADIPGLSEEDTDLALTDGVIIDYRYFGNEGVVSMNSKYNMGRTTTHEVGHWLGLLHTWGDQFCGDDYCEDTPTIERSNNDAISCEEVYSRCRGVLSRNMIENYMDYSPDGCMNTFTVNQLERMMAVWELSPRRRQLLENIRKNNLPESEQLTIQIYPNPIVAEGRLEFSTLFKGNTDVTWIVRDLLGNTLASATVYDTFSRFFSVKLPNLTRGIYLLEVKTVDNQRTIKRFVVN